MGQTGSRERVVVSSGTLFAATLAQNAGLAARIPLPESVAAGRHARCLIESIQIVSADQLDFEVWFWGNQNGQQSGHPDLESFLGFWSFSVAGGDGKQIAGVGLYYYYIDGLGIHYYDFDAHNQPALGAFLNVTLVNRSAGAKSAGWFQIAFGVQPTQGW